MAASYGLAALSGLLGGLQGVPQGLFKGADIDQRQQQIDEQRRQFDEGRSTDTSAIGIPGRTPNALIPILGAQGLEERKLARTTQERKGSADAFRRAAVTTNNPNLNTLADLLESGGIKEPGSIYETELKGQQSVAEKNNSLDVLRQLGILPNMPDVPQRGAPPMAAADQAVGAYNAPPGAVPGLIQPPGGGAGGGPTPMPNSMSAFRPDISLKVGPATINLKTPTDERDSYASSLFNGLLFHQLRPEQQAKVLEALPTSPSNRLAQARGQGENAAQIQLDKARETVLPPEQASSLGVPYGTTQQGAYGKTPIPTAQQNKAGAGASALAIIAGVEKELSGLALPSGPAGRLAQMPQNLWGVYGQGDPKMAALKSRIDGTLSTVIRALGEVGTLSDKDIARAKSLWPVFVPVPDSKEVVAEKMRGLRELVQDVSGRAGAAGAAPVAPGGPPARRRFNPATGLLE